VRPIAKRPVLAALLLSLGWIAVSIVVVLGARALVPDIEPQAAALAALVVETLLVLLLLAGLGWWREVGLNGPSAWRDPALFLVPLALVLLPLVAGIKPIDGATLGFLLVGYLLTGFTEEVFARGILLRVLRPEGAIRSVVVAALLFGMLHLANVVIRGNPAIIAAQAVGAATFAIGYGALRLRTNTLVPLIGLHALHDLVLQLGTLPLIPVDVAQDVVLFIFGLWLLRGLRTAMPRREAAVATT
jgi:membrane protease YdiL (CAAX protease family)